MEAQVEDFLSGLLDGCTGLMERWQRRHGVGSDWTLARLSCWQGLAHAVAAAPSCPGRLRLDLDPMDYRLMWSESRALRLLQDSGPTPPELMPALVERIYAVIISPFDPRAPFSDAASSRMVAEWARRHSTPPGLPQSAMALVDFIQQAPLAARNAQMAALLASVMPSWAGAPMVHVLPPDGRAEEGFAHAIAAACDGEDGAWIAYYMGRARGVLKRMPLWRNGADEVRQRLTTLLASGPLNDAAAAALAAELVALPVLTGSFLADSGIAADCVDAAMTVLAAAGEVAEVELPGQSVTVVTAPLALLAV